MQVKRDRVLETLQEAGWELEPPGKTTWQRYAPPVKDGRRIDVQGNRVVFRNIEMPFRHPALIETPPARHVGPSARFELRLDRCSLDECGEVVRAAIGLDWKRLDYSHVRVVPAVAVVDKPDDGRRQIVTVNVCQVRLNSNTPAS